MKTELSASAASPVKWENNRLFLLDQRLLPGQKVYIALSAADELARAIRDMVVRGAPAIGVAAAYGVALSALEHEQSQSMEKLAADMEQIAASRPTAVNLRWAVERMKRLLVGNIICADKFIAEAKAIHRQAVEDDDNMAYYGAQLLDGGDVLTHCNAGALATCGIGTALGVIRAGVEAGRINRVFADETRPWLQGARLTAWELLQDGIKTTLTCEGAAASLMSRGALSWVIVGADRVAANGDVANKIGTCALAVLAKYYGVKFMVVAPWSTIDLSADSGEQIPVENRAESEVLCVNGQRIAAQGADAWNPVFDITPASLITALVTEKGVIMQPDKEKIAQMAS